MKSVHLSQRNQLYLSVLIALSLGLTVAREVVLPGVEWGWHVIDFTGTTFMILVIWQFVEWLHRALNQSLPLENHLLLRIIVQFTISKIFAASLVTIGSYLAQGLIPHLIDYMTRPTRFLLIMVSVSMVVIVKAVLFAEYFLNRWKENALRAARLEKEKAQVQFDNLKNQLNPHFLFNSLTSLDGLIHENPDLASQFLRQLAKVFRYVLQHKDKELVGLQTELDFVRNYVSLLKTRFDGSLQVHFDVPVDISDKAIVPVTLQILIENAIKHNVANARQPLDIHILATDEYLTVENNCQPKAVETSNRQGLTNLRVLYRFLTEREVEVTQEEGRFRVRVPLVQA